MTLTLSDLHYDYPEHLIAQEPRFPKRVMWVDSQGPSERTVGELIESIPSGDVLVINDTQVVKRRVFSLTGEEILFLSELEGSRWEVLFPSAKYKIGHKLMLPGEVEITLLQKGRPQIIQSQKPLTESYFDLYGELPLPPYIQQARKERHNRPQDKTWYQTAWAQNAGSYAAPTASLHFSQNDLQKLKDKGVLIEKITLHVGLGTFLPIQAEKLQDHQMHREKVLISTLTWQNIVKAKNDQKKIWSLGTTTTRALESVLHNKLKNHEHGFEGETDLFIQPGFEYKVVDRLLTNFHLPGSSLLALVAGFVGLEKVKSSYAWAIEKNFQLFSYGDLSVWIK